MKHNFLSVEFILGSVNGMLVIDKGTKSFISTLLNKIHMQTETQWGLPADANVSEEHDVSIFRAEDGDSVFLRKVAIHQRV
jgi:hypothetical protein